ncbi:hypothetical protein WJX75_001630 [Coccomyxa subellipsoidea]|uniref:Uncharacterized protein n=1 Tax=Coccomyxa subellipsoidea TaxID=248742 RepID=A0ABR2YCD4_9CHLO
MLSYLWSAEMMEAANALVSLDPQQQQQQQQQQPPLPERQRRQLRRRPQVQMPAPPNWHPYAAEGALVGLDPGREQRAGASRASAAPAREERTAKGMIDYHGVSWHTRNMKWRMTLTILQQWDGRLKQRHLGYTADLLHAVSAYDQVVIMCQESADLGTSARPHFARESYRPLPELRAFWLPHLGIVPPAAASAEERGTAADANSLQEAMPARPAPAAVPNPCSGNTLVLCFPPSARRPCSAGRQRDQRRRIAQGLRSGSCRPRAEEWCEAPKKRQRTAGGRREIGGPDGLLPCADMTGGGGTAASMPAAQGRNTARLDATDPQDDRFGSLSMRGLGGVAPFGPIGAGVVSSGGAAAGAMEDWSGEAGLPDDTASPSDDRQGDRRRPTTAEKGKARARCDSSDSDEEGGSARLPSERLIIGGMRPSDGSRSGRRLSFDDRFLLSEDVTCEGQAAILKDIEARTPLRFCRATPSDAQLPHYEHVAPEEEVTSDGELQERIARMMDEQLGQGPTFGSAGTALNGRAPQAAVAAQASAGKGFVGEAVGGDAQYEGRRTAAAAAAAVQIPASVHDWLPQRTGRNSITQRALAEALLGALPADDPRHRDVLIWLTGVPLPAKFPNDISKPQI